MSIQSLPSGKTLDYHEIASLLPYRSPWLQIDQLLDWDQTSITVQKVISGADLLIAAHFKNGPSIMPGVLQVELVNQAAMLHAQLHSGATGASLEAGALGRCQAHFFTPAFIGETLQARVQVIQRIAGTSAYEGVIESAGRLVCKTTCIGANLPHRFGAVGCDTSLRGWR